MILQKAQYNQLEAICGIGVRIGHGSLTGLDPNTELVPNYTTGGTRNFECWSDPQVDKLVAEQSVTVDPAKRSALILEIERLLFTSSHRLPLWWPNQFLAMQPYVKGVVPHPIDHTTSTRFERAWLDK